MKKVEPRAVLQNVSSGCMKLCGLLIFLPAPCEKLPLMVWNSMRVMQSCFGAGERILLAIWLTAPRAAITAFFQWLLRPPCYCGSTCYLNASSVQKTELLLRIHPCPQTNRYIYAQGLSKTKVSLPFNILTWVTVKLLMLPVHYTGDRL